jgi:multiple antibiotic resistance protein
VPWTNPAEIALSEIRTAPIVRFSLLAFSSIFFLVDPFAAIPSFLAITHRADPVRRKHMARKAALTCFIVLTSFAVAGQLIFQLFGITLPAFEVAGGLILLLIGLDMLEARRSPTQETLGDAEEAAAKEDAGIVPLGVPMLAGAGAISSVMVLVGQVPHLWHWEMAAILGAITITSLVSYWVLAGAGRVRQVMGETGIRILVRIMGLLLVALAMQLFRSGDSGKAGLMALAELAESGKTEVFHGSRLNLPGSEIIL